MTIEDMLYVVMAYDKDDSSPLAVPVFIAYTVDLAQATAEEFCREAGPLNVGVEICAVPAGRSLSPKEFYAEMMRLYAALPFDR